MACGVCARLVATLLLVAIVCHATSYSTMNQSHQKHSGRASKFLLILFDGLRWDYPDFQGLDNFKRFQKLGIRAQYMQVDFPSLSFPGYYTILTGLHPESNGFIENNMYDPQRKKFFDVHLGHDSNDSFWWEQSEPLWTAAVRSGKKTYVYMWPGCHVPIHNVTPQFCQPYEFVNDTKRLEENLGDIVEKFSSGVADVGFVYVEHTDHIGHAFGPDSPEVKAAMTDLDRAIGNLLDGLDKRSLTNKVNIIFVSDHGMTGVDRRNWTIIPVADVINLDDVEMLIGSGATMGIIPLPGKIDAVYDALKKEPCYYVWKKDEIPDALHFKRDPKVPPIQIAAKPRCLIGRVALSKKQFPYYDPSKYPNGEPTVFGDHGYLPEENQDMRAFFMAMGPAFVQDRRVDPIYSVDVYQLAVHLMEVDGHPTNGTWSHVSGMLKSSTNSSTTTPQLGQALLVLLFGAILLIF